MKQVIYKTSNGYYITSEANYNARIQNAKAVKHIDGATTTEDIREFIANCCKWYGDSEGNYIIK